MSSNNQPPFYVGQKVVAIRDCSSSFFTRQYKKGDVMVVDELSKSPISDVWHFLADGSIDEYFACQNFAPYNPPYQSDLTRELAEQALSVGDSVDQPVKKLVNN